MSNLFWVEQQGWFMNWCKKCQQGTKHVIEGDYGACYYVRCDGCEDTKSVLKYDVANLADKEAE
jgi:hypothetical protein